MKKLGQLRFATRAAAATNNLAAFSLGELQGPTKRLATRLCQVHRWRQSKYSRTCTRCGFVEDK